MEKKRKWRFSKVISMLLIVAMFSNEIIGETGLAWAAQETVEIPGTDETEGEETTEPSETDEAEEENGEETEKSDENGQESGENDGEQEIVEGEEEAEDARDAEAYLQSDEPQQVRILEEDVTKRSSNIKYFLNEDHTCTAAVYPEPVHYEEDGEWKEIDNQLEEVTEEGETSLVNRQNPFQVKFTDTSAAEGMVEVGLGEFQLSWGLSQVQEVPAVQEAKSRDAAVVFEEQEEEEPSGEAQEEEATLLTENPDAAAATLSDVVTQSLENAYGKQLQNLPENNVSEGIPAEQQISWEENCDSEEKDKRAEDYEQIQEANQERLAVDTSSAPVLYEEVYPDVDLEYTVQGQKLKENIIMKSPEAQNRFSFQMETDGMEIREEGNSLLFVDGDGKTVFEMQRPFLYDAEGKRSEDVAVELTGGTGKRSILTLTAGEEWLREETRAYPVTLDPVIETSQSAKAIQDTYVLSNAPTKNYYTNALLKTGANAAGGTARSFLRFELPKLSSGDMVVDARLCVYCYSSGTSNVTVGVSQAYGEWKSQEVTWATQPMVNGNLDDYVVFKPETGVAQSFSITRMVKEWYETGVNGGLMMRAVKEDGQYTEYVSSDFPIQAKDCRPSVLITYLNNSGLEDYWGNHSQDVGRAGTGYVNDYNGNLVFSRSIWNTSGSRMPISLNLVYNSNDRETNLGYGYGWRLNLLQTLEKQNIRNQEYYQYTDEDGTRHYFYYDSQTQTWKDESGIDLTLTILANGQGYQIKDKQDNLLIFDTSGKMIKIQDQNGNTLIAGHDGGKLTSLQDGKGKKVFLGYGADGMLGSVTEQPGKAVTFTYESNQLCGVKDRDGKSTAYTYGNGHTLTGAENIDGYRIQYGYTEQAPYRVKTIQEFAGKTEGQSLTLERYDNRTKYTDNKGRTETCLFNHMGNTISVKNNKGYAQSARYLTEKSKTNKISKVTKLQSPGKNLLENGYLEDSSGWQKIQQEATAALETDAGKALEGQNVMHLSSGQVTGKAGFYQQVTLEAGKTYTFSAYIKTSREAMEQGRFQLQLLAELADGEKQYAREQDYYETENGWYRMMTTLNVPEGAAVNAAKVSISVTGKADGYVDCLQLEEGLSAGRYNLIEGGDFDEGLLMFEKTEMNIYDRVIDSTEPDTTLQYVFRRGVVSDTEVNLRSGPGTNHTIVSSAKRGEHVTAIGQAVDSNGVTWYLTYLIKDRKLYTGYMISQFIDFSSQFATESTIGVVDATKLNVRQGAGTGYAVIDTLEQNQNPNVHIVDYVTSAVGQSWDVIAYEKDGEYRIGCVLGAYIYSTWMQPSIEPMQTEVLDKHVFYVTGNPAKVKKLTQTLWISGKAGDSYMGNVWGCGYPTERKDGRVFGLEVTFVGADGSREAYTSEFKADTTTWQFLNDIFIPKKAYEKIEVSCVYSYETNVAAFDGLALYREDFAESYLYDDKGNIVSVQENAKTKSKFDYDGNNNLIKMTDPKGYSFQYTYDTRHNVTKAVSTERMTYQFSYDSYGNAKESKIVDADIEEEYIRSTADYTADGAYLQRITDALGNRTKYAYEEETGLLAEVTDPSGNATSYAYDAADQLTGVTDGTGQIQYSYENDELRQIQINDPESGTVYRFENDGFGNAKATYVGDSCLVSQTYEEKNGNLLAETYGNGYVYQYTYDDMDRVTGIRLTDPSGEEYRLYEYAYDREGNLAVVRDIREDLGEETIETRYFYDLSGRLVYYRNDRDEDYRFTYDLNDNVEKVDQGNRYRATALEYGYDRDNRAIGVTSGECTEAVFYDGLGRVVSKALGKIFEQRIQYGYREGADGSQSDQLERFSWQGLQNNYEIHYQYDANRNITQTTDGKGKIQYTYDTRNQLIREDREADRQTITYAYDKNGNLLQKNRYEYQPEAAMETLASATPSETKIYRYEGNWKDQLTSYNGETIAYDAMGNPTVYRGMELGWKNSSELTEIVKDQTTIRYRYDKEGMRNRKYLSDGTTVLYQVQDGQIIGEQHLREDQEKPLYEMTFSYDADGTLFSMNCDGKDYYYILNPTGDVIALVDTGWNTVVSYAYDSWGKVTAIEGDQDLGKKNPLRYRGYYWDEEIGLYYLASRYYDPEVGRFINADDLSVLSEEKREITDKNLYAYCDNNPIIRKDNEGDMWQLALAGVGGNGFGTMIATGLGVITPAGWIVLGSVTVVVVGSIVYSKAKSRYSGQIKGKKKTKKKEKSAEEDKRNTNPIAKRYRFNSRKKAKQQAQRAGKGKANNHYSKKGAHFHPDVKQKYRKTPKGVTFHDHYYYPR